MPFELRYKRSQLRLINILITIPVRVSSKKAKLYIVKNRADSVVSHIRKGQFDVEEEEKMANTIRYKKIIKSDISLRKLADRFEVYYIKFHRRMKDQQNRLNYNGRNTLLIEEQETVIF